MGKQDRVVPAVRSLVINAVADQGSGKGYRKLALITNRGVIGIRHYEAPGARAGVVWAGGVGRGFDSPARDLYGEMASDLLKAGVSSLRLSYRCPGELDESILDVMAAVALLDELGMAHLALVGHSFGGAVVIRAAVRSRAVRTVVALSSQSCGADTVDQLSPRSLLLIHGENDRILPPYCSASLFAKALEPKRLLLLPGTGHNLREARATVITEVMNWLMERLVRLVSTTRPRAVAAVLP